MFDLSEKPLVWIPVKWLSLRPGPKAGDLAVEHENEIKVEVELKDRDELVEFFADALSETPQGKALKDSVAGDAAQDVEAPIGEEAGEKPSPRVTEAERFLGLVKNWSGVADKGQPIELNLANAKRMLAVPGFAGAFETAYLLACAGKVETRKGN